MGQAPAGGDRSLNLGTDMYVRRTWIIEDEGWSWVRLTCEIAGGVKRGHS